jgi:hypothetical protein
LASRGKKGRTKKGKEEGNRPAKPKVVAVVDDEPSSAPPLPDAVAVEDVSGAEVVGGEKTEDALDVFDLDEDARVDAEAVEAEKVEADSEEEAIEAEAEAVDAEAVAAEAEKVEAEAEEVEAEAEAEDVRAEAVEAARPTAHAEPSATAAQTAEADDALDLGPTSTPEARARLLAEALAHADMQEARYRVPTESRRLGRIKGGIALAIFLLAGILVLAPPRFVSPEAPVGVADADRVSGVITALLLQAEQVDAFRVRERRLPLSLDELGVAVPGVRYVRSSNRLYQLIAYAPTGRAVVYDSAAPAPAFGEAEVAWRGEGGGS